MTPSHSMPRAVCGPRPTGPGDERATLSRGPLLERECKFGQTMLPRTNPLIGGGWEFINSPQPTIAVSGAARMPCI